MESLQEEVNRLYEMLIELIARNRNLSIEAIKSTEAGLYFGQNAIEIGLADGITTFSELREKILFINKKEVFNMNEQTTADFSDKVQTDDLIEEAKRIGYNNCRTEVLEVIRLCNLSKMPEKITEFIEQNVSSKQAQEILVSTLAERTTKAEIFSTLPQNSSENLVIQAAKARVQSSI
jgi:ClpP class serine protease